MGNFGQKLEDLGLSQYYDKLVAEGFDSWETVLDITESDLNLLGFKLGHRRKLQRAIAETRTQYPDRALPLFQGKPAGGDGAYRSDDSNEVRPVRKGEGNAATGTASTKRKYRRHPKPDEHAPERPPSAYVIFSNQMREELKGQELSFTEIAKVVGERWQVLSPEAREGYEKEANTAKEKYYAELAEYKKTPQWTDYQEYLKDFKAKHAPAQSEGKRSKLETETSTSSQISRDDRRRDQPTSRHQRSGSSPTHTHPRILTQGAPATAGSPPTYPYASINSPRIADAYSPMSISPRNGFHAGFVDGRERTSESLTTGAPGLQTYHSRSSTPPSSGYPYRDLSRRTYRDSPSLPPLIHEDTTISSDGSVMAGTTPLAGTPRLPPIMTDPKTQRFLPQPIPSITPPVTTSYDARTLAQPLTLPPDTRPGASSIAALLRADELTRSSSGS